MKGGHLKIIIFFVLITLLMTYPLIFYMPYAVPTGLWFHHDAFLNIWILSWDLHIILKEPLNFYNANIFYPMQNSLTLSEHLLGDAILALPVRILNDNPVLIYNFVYLFVLFLSGFGSYLLFFHLTKDRFSSFFAGLVFAFISARFRYITLIQIQSTQWVPFIFLYFIRFIEKKNPKDGILFSLFLFFNIITSVYLTLIMMAFFCIFLVTFFIITGIKYFNKEFFKRALPSFLFLAILLTLALIFYKPYIKIYSSGLYTDYEARAEEVLKNSAKLSFYFNVQSGSLFWRHFYPSITSAEGLFPGIIILILLFTGIFGLRKIDLKQREFIISFIFAGIFCFLFSFGTRFFAFPFLAHIAPFFSGIRVPERFSMGVIFSISMLAATGMNFLKKELLKFIVLILFIVENMIIPVRLTLVQDILKPEPVYLWLRNQPEDVLIELPMPDETEKMWLEVKYTINSIHHWKRIVNGYSGYYPQSYSKIREAVFRGFPKKETLLLLKNYGIKLIVVHTEYFDKGIWNQLSKFIQESPLVPVMDFGIDKVYKIPDDLR